MSDGTPLDRAEYVSFGSYRKNGTLVPTPVWIAPLDGKLVVFTLRETYKVKRVRNNPRVRLAQCDVRGKLLGEAFYDGDCVIVSDPEHEKRAYAAFRKKYGLLMRLGDIGSFLSGRMKRRVILEVTLDDPPPSA
jgi:PPOX class probable F420-dependent enzyme